LSTREGSLEAPTRHPIDWKSPDFHDEEKLNAELHRVYDICHGCRRCVSLCTAFPTLFDLVDESKTGEVDGVDTKDFGKVVDQCYLCDLCYMTKCPYVPPHQWNVDFPHLMLRAKAVRFRKGEVRFRDRLLSATDAIGKLAAIPVVAQTVNLMNNNGAARALMQKIIGVTELQRKFRSFFEDVVRKRTPLVLTRGSRPEAALIPYEDYLRFQQMQESEVLARFDQVWTRLAQLNASFSEEEIAADIRDARQG